MSHHLNHSSSEVSPRGALLLVICFAVAVAALVFGLVNAAMSLPAPAAAPCDGSCAIPFLSLSPP